MADLRRSMRDLFLQGVEAVNTAANHVANATRSKVDELNLRNRRRELLDSLANALYEQWRQGLELPEALTETLRQLRDIDEQLAEFEKPEPETTDAEAAPDNPQDRDNAPTIVVDEEEKAADIHIGKTEVPSIQIDEPDHDPENL